MDWKRVMIFCRKRKKGGKTNDLKLNDPLHYTTKVLWRQTRPIWKQQQIRLFLKIHGHMKHNSPSHQQERFNQTHICPWCVLFFLYIFFFRFNGNIIDQTKLKKIFFSSFFYDVSNVVVTRWKFMTLSSSLPPLSVDDVWNDRRARHLAP